MEVSGIDHAWWMYRGKDIRRGVHPMDGGLFPEPETKTAQIKNPSWLNLSVQTGGIFLLCEIIGHVTEIVSNQYHLLVPIQKVIALQRLFNFRVSQGKPIFKLYPIKWTKWVFRNP